MTSREQAANGIDPWVTGSFERYMEHRPTAIAVIHGPEHSLRYANLAFRQLTNVSIADLGVPITQVLRGRDVTGLIAALDRVLQTGERARDVSAAIIGDGASSWHCSVWPESSPQGRPEHLVVELWESSQADLILALQREVAERLLLSSLRERDATERAEESSRRATFLAIEGGLLAQSIDETTTRQTVAALTLPSLAAWCIVDVLDDNGDMHRLRIVHPNAAKQALLRGLEGHWSPEPADFFGLPAVVRNREPSVIESEQLDEALVAGAHGAESLRILRSIGIGALLTVPLVLREKLLGAVTFVSHQRDRGFSSEDVDLAEALAVRSAIALDSARVHAVALELKSVAEAASQAKTAFLGTMSHELRTPLNAIGGYVDLIDLGLRGPVTEPQRTDLGRIRRNQRHLLGLITDLLNFVRVGSGGILYNIRDMNANEAVASTVTLIDALMVRNGIICDLEDCDDSVVAHADSEKVQQILLNLLTNAIKFTPPGGCISIHCHEKEKTILIQVADTGIGIPADRLEAIFDPFVQVKEGFAGRDTGVGLGLAISRDLARAMNGELGAESELGRWSRFTLVLPRATSVHEQE